MSDLMIRELWDWRRRVAGLYDAVRRAEHPEAGWRLWRAERDRLFREHPQSPIEYRSKENRAEFAGLPFFDYDPALRFSVGLRAAHGPAFTVSVGGDGAMRLRPFAMTDGLSALGGELTLFWVEGYGGGVFLPFTDATSGRESLWGWAVSARHDQGGGFGGDRGADGVGLQLRL